MNTTHTTAPHWLTVWELKKLLADWPELDEYGEPCEVWVETAEGQSTQVKTIYPINVRGESADLLLSLEPKP